MSYRYHTSSSNLSYLTVYYSTLSYSIVHSYLTLLYNNLTLHYLVLPTDTLPYPTLPYPTLSYPTQPYPTPPYHTLPYSTPPYPTLPYPTLSSITLHTSVPCHALLYVDVDFSSSHCIVADLWKDTEGAGALAQGREQGQGQDDFALTLPSTEGCLSRTPPLQVTTAIRLFIVRLSFFVHPYFFLHPTSLLPVFAFSLFSSLALHLSQSILSHVYHVFAVHLNY